MGADLIGYLVTGPAKLDESKRQQAIDKIVGRSTWAMANEDANRADLSEDENEQLERITEELNKSAHDSFHDYAAEIVDKLLELWPFEGERTTVVRTDPFNPARVLLFTGEMSWGDAPDTDTFQLITALAAFDVLEIFDIR